MDENQLTGIILSGGKSSRMGREKGLVNFRGKPLISYSIEVLKQLTGTIIIGANNNLEEYKKFGFDVVNDEVEGIGPMGGLLSTLRYSTTDKNLVVSCDTPFINSGLLQYLMRYMQDYDIVAASHGNGKTEPLCAIYSRNVIPVMEKKVNDGVFKLRSIFQEVRFRALRVDTSLPFYMNRLFYNVNIPEDLNI